MPSNLSNDSNDLLVNLTADIVAAHVSNNNVAIGDISSVIRSVHDALTQLGKPAEVKEELVPAVSIKASVKPDYIVCLEDGKRLTMLKRYLMTHYNLTPDQYRARWGLPRDYPMVAPAYAERRSALAKEIGLGGKNPVGRPRKAGPAKKKAAAS